jgi:hypothetical protein
MIRKNKKFIDPRYFMDEKLETIKEVATIDSAARHRPASATTSAVPNLQEDNSPPEVDIANALELANGMEASGDIAMLRYVIEALESALGKLSGSQQ